jgi:hypothetical protein
MPPQMHPSDSLCVSKFQEIESVKGVDMLEFEEICSERHQISGGPEK